MNKKVIFGGTAALAAGGIIAVGMSHAKIDKMLNEQLQKEINSGTISGYKDAHCEGLLNHTCYIDGLQFTPAGAGQSMTIRRMTIKNPEGYVAIENGGLAYLKDAEVSVEARGIYIDGTEAMQSLRDGLKQNVKAFPGEVADLEHALDGDMAVLFDLKARQNAPDTTDAELNLTVETGKSISAAAYVNVLVPKIAQENMTRDTLADAMMKQMTIRAVTLRLDTKKGLVRDIFYAIYLQDIEERQTFGYSRQDAIASVNAQFNLDDSDLLDKETVANLAAQLFLEGFKQSNATGKVADALGLSFRDFIAGKRQYVGIRLVNQSDNNFMTMLQAIMLDTGLKNVTIEPL